MCSHLDGNQEVASLGARRGSGDGRGRRLEAKGKGTREACSLTPTGFRQAHEV